MSQIIVMSIRKLKKPPHFDMSKNFAYTLFFLLACLSSNYSANGHAGVGVVVKDGCDRYLAIGTWHSSISELNSTINSNRGLYIDINKSFF